jgi:hypothetical protein
MQSLIESAKTWFVKQAQRAGMTEEERYLSDSVDLVDLENRQKLIMYNQAPYQINGRHWLDSQVYQ